jgi:hypothetical protein
MRVLSLNVRDRIIIALGNEPFRIVKMSGVQVIVTVIF